MVWNAPHLHLMLNHYPLFAVFFAVALLIAGIALRARALRLAGYVMLCSAAVLAIVVYATGVASEDAVEHLPGVLERAIELHEDVAKGVLTLLFPLASLAAFGYSAQLGGLIHHPEIRGGAL